MIFREATLDDIPDMMKIRFAVKENRLSNAGIVTAKDCEHFLTERGKGWVCEIDDSVVGFAIADLIGNNIWALFIEPGFEGKGVGRKLHQKMLDWYFIQTNEKVWLGTMPGTRAEKFYRRAGWKETGIQKNGEIKFEMTVDEWQTNSRQL